MKVILDANILISFLLTQGTTISKIVDAWKKNKFILLLTDEILTEIRQVFERFVAAKLVNGKAALALLQRLEKECLFIHSLSVVTASPDRKDNRYLSCARDGRADFLVTGDKKHLLNLKNFGGTKIISPRDFVEILKTD